MEKRTPTERDRKPRFSDDADFSAFEPTRRPRRNRSPFEEFPRPCDLLRKRRFRLQTSADRRDGKTTQENIARLRQNLYFNESSRKKTGGGPFLLRFAATRRRERSGVLSSTVRPKRWARPVETPTRAYPNRLPDLLVFVGTNLHNAFFLRSAPNVSRPPPLRF